MNSEDPYMRKNLQNLIRKVTPTPKSDPGDPPTPPSPPSDPPKTPKSADGADPFFDPQSPETDQNSKRRSGIVQKWVLRVLAKWVFWVLWGGPRASKSQILRFPGFIRSFCGFFLLYGSSEFIPKITKSKRTKYI